MKVLVVGGRGYIGSVLCPQLASEGVMVDSLDLNWFESPEYPGVEYKYGNMLAVDSLEGYDAVVALAALSCDPMADYNPGQSFAYNVGGPFHLAKIAKRDGVRRFILASTTSVYGFNPRIMSETDELNAVSYYGMSKKCVEKALADLSSDNFSTAFFRLGTLGGPSSRMRLDLVVNAMTIQALIKGVIVVNNPYVLRPHLDVRDASRIFAEACHSVTIPFKGAFNVAYSNHTIMDIAEHVKHKVSARIEVLDTPECRSYLADTSKLGQEKWVPKYSLDDSIDGVIEWAENCKDWTDQKYYNIRVYKRLIA